MNKKKKTEIDPSVEPIFSGKTIVKAVYEGDEGDVGYGDLTFYFTDGTTAKVCYSCMGGVYATPVK